jgi:acetylglutamate synthase
MFSFSNEIDDKTGKTFYHFAQKLYDYVKNNLKFDQDVKSVRLVSDLTNSEDVLGKTAYYDPQNFEIVLYCDGRHLKDILRSFSHELIHHSQNCNGAFSEPSVASQDGYAQKDPHLRNMEKDAYLNGNMLFRDWEDELKNERKSVMENKKKKSDIWALDPHEDLSVLKHKREIRFEETLKRLGVKFDPNKLAEFYKNEGNKDG